MKKNKVVITKQQAIFDLMDNLAGKSFDEIIECVNFYYKRYLNNCSLKQLEEEYITEFAIDEYQKELNIINTKASKILFERG